MALRCLIVDDEPPAQRIVERYAGDIPYLEVVGKAATPSEALDILKKERIDVIFLDINLPRLSGIEFLKSVEHLPEVIITTAYPEYALKGFELNVRDYLVKPISFERFVKAVSRIPSASEDNQRPRQANKQLDYTFVKTDGVIYRIPFDKILYISSDGDYVHIYMESDHYYLRQTLKYWHELLPDESFFQVHKSYIVNLSHINEIVGNIIKMGDHEIPVGRNYKHDFLKRIEELQ